MKANRKFRNVLENKAIDHNQRKKNVEKLKQQKRKDRRKYNLHRFRKQRKGSKQKNKKFKKKYDIVNENLYYRTKDGKKHPSARIHNQIERGFEIAKKWRSN